MDKRRVGKRAGIAGLYLLGAILGFKAPDFIDALKMRELQMVYDAVAKDYFGASAELDRLNRKISGQAGLRFGHTEEIYAHIRNKFGVSTDDIFNERLPPKAKEEMDREIKNWADTVQREGQKDPKYMELRAQLRQIAQPYLKALHANSEEKVRQYFHKPLLAKRALGVAAGVGLVGAGHLWIRKLKQKRKMQGPRQRHGKR